MKKVDIKSIVIPNRSRSGNYPTGSTVTPSGGGSNSTIINQGGGVDLTQARKEFLSKKTSDEAKGIINFLKGIKIAGRNISNLLQKNSEEEITDEAIMSAARVILEIGNAIGKLDNKFLRKDIPESTQFLLSLLAGAVFGKDGFASGLTGYGAKIDENGNAEVESLTSRRFIETPEFRYNRVDVKVGDKWRAPGAGIIESVDTESKICTLKLEEGEIGAVAVGDICMGIFHSLTSSDNATEDTDDSRGNRTFAGFCTVYFTITEVIGSRNEQFKYQIRPVSERWKYSFDPFSQMNFVAYGSFTREDRQTSVYETRTYTRHLWKQNTWEIGVANIAKQSGDLSNLNVFGLNMEGYSEYTNSVYFTGTVTQIKPDGTPVITANDRGAWPPEDNHADYYDRFSYDGCLWLCVNENGTDTAPSKENPNWLLQVDKGSQGNQGEKGEQGIPGEKGADGKTSYFHLKYSENPDGNPMTETPSTYIGTYVDFEQADSDDYTKYVWARFKGLQGEKGDQGIPGYNGVDGKTYYLHIKYSNDGGNTFTSNNGEDAGDYIGQYVDTNSADSNKPSDYKWAKIKGDKGDQGEKGETGETGAQGKQGLDGCVIRDSEWAIGTEYRNDSNITDGSLDVRYIDVVLVANEATETGWDAYKCLKTHVSSESITYTNTSYWEKFGANVGAIFTSLIVAKNAKIKFLSGNQLTIQKSDGTVTAGLSGSDEGEKVRFWAGSETPDNAPYKVDETGRFTAEEGIFKGFIQKKMVTITSSNISEYIKQNTAGNYCIDLYSAGNLIYLEENPDAIIYLPQRISGRELFFDGDVRGLLGEHITIYNATSSEFRISGVFFNNDPDSSVGSIIIKPGYGVFLTCDISADLASITSSPTETISWRHKIFKIM